MEAVRLDQPRRQETACEAKCSKCGEVVYCETIVEVDGFPVERVVTGTFRQALDSDGNPSGPVIPFCNCKG